MLPALPLARRIALALAALGLLALIWSAHRFGDPFASLGALWYDASRATITLLQRALDKTAPALWTYLAAPLLRLPAALIMLIAAAELFLASRRR